MTDRFFKRLAVGGALATAALAAIAAGETPAATAAKPAAAASAPMAAAPAPVTVPAVKPVTVPAAKPVTVPATAPAAASAAAAPNAAAGEVETAVRAWATAWSAKDADRYVAAYAKDFKPARKSHKAWEEQRRARIAKKSSIAVTVDDLVVSVHGDSATAKFKQTYKADKIAETGRKTLQLQRTGGQWLIKKESAGS